jgi:ABC-2 type transport system permease protein
MKIFISMVLRELRAVRKEKTIMFAILIQFFIASCSSILLTGLMAFYDPDSIGYNTNITIRVGVIGDYQNEFRPFLRERNISVVRFNDAERAEFAFKSGYIEGIVYLPAPESGIVNMKLVLPEMDARATVALMILKGPLQQYENYLRKQQGIQLRYDDIKGKPSATYEFLYTIIIPVLMFFPAFVAGSMVIDNVSEEIENKTLATLLSTPVSLNYVFGSKVIASLVIAIIQCVLWALLLQLNGFVIQNIVFVLIFAIVIAAILSIAAGLVSTLFRDRERSQFIYSIVIVIAAGLSFLSDPSPAGMVARLATGDPLINFGQVFLYMILLTVLALVFFRVLNKVVARAV